MAVKSPHDIGRLAREQRKKRGLSQQSLALVSRCGLSFVRELEQGKPKCHIGKFLSVCEVLGLELDTVLGQRHPEIICPGSKVRLVKLWPHARKHGYEIGQTWTVGYYSRQDGLDTIWL
jgi:y4mF family transcriptional regulator